MICIFLIKTWGHCSNLKFSERIEIGPIVFYLFIYLFIYLLFFFFMCVCVGGGGGMKYRLRYHATLSFNVHKNILLK